MSSRTSFNSFVLQASAVLVILGSISCSCLEFSYQTFDTANQADFSFSPGSGIANGSLQITPSTGNVSGRSGRVCYARETFNLWNSKMTVPVSFYTEFVLNIQPQNGTVGEGMAFILTNNPALPSDSSGQWLGITNKQTDGATTNRIVAVEFDTRKSFKEDLEGNHVGIDINSIKTTDGYGYPLSNVSLVLSRGSDVLVAIGYDGVGAMLGMRVRQDGYFLDQRWPLNLSLYLLENITLGFAASTGDFTVLNRIKSWNFTTVDGATDSKLGHRSRRKLTLVLVFLTLFFIALMSLLVFFIWRRMTQQRRLAYRNLEKMIDARGPVRFKLRELRSATANFSPGRKLGMGGFGTVYLGNLQRTMEMTIQVAVKRVSTTTMTGNSNRGEQEFLAEVNTISKLSHRNLVKLIGWCHESGELLLVYEYFPMGSLDKHLYAGERSGASTPESTAAAASPELTWGRRYKIICGVASALEYLHHGSSRRILHRDVKASNVMLDAEYSARLGDFGLARVVELDGATHHSTQAVAGTRAYMAQESFFTGRATLATDVYAFGVFVMEVLSGRRPSSPVPYLHRDGEPSCRRGRRQPQQQPMFIVDWAWRLYGEGRALDAADGAVLNGGGAEVELDLAQVERAVRLALACCHPDPRERPSMRTAVQVLVDGAKAPDPPLQKPAFVWPPRGDEAPEIELPDVGLLFTGGQTTYCSLSRSSFTVTGR